MVQLVLLTRVRELERRAGEAEGIARRHDVSKWRGQPPDQSPAETGASGHRCEGTFPLDLPAWSSGDLTGGRRRRLSRDVNEACRALDGMHGEENRPTALPPSLVASEDKNQCLRADVQRVILAALRWVDADSAVDEHEALAKLLKERTEYAPGVSSNVGSYEYSRFSLPESVVDAPPLIDVLPAEANIFLEEFQSRMLLPPEVAAAIQEIMGEPGCHNDPRLLSGARSYARLVR